MALRSVTNHPKFARLKTLTGLTKGPTLGYIEACWHFTGLFSPTGDIGRFTDEEIEGWVEWTGPPGALIEALVTSRFVDRDAQYRLIVHNWHLHADATTKRQLTRNAREMIVAGRLKRGEPAIFLQTPPLKFVSPRVTNPNAGNVTNPEFVIDTSTTLTRQGDDMSCPPVPEPETNTSPLPSVGGAPKAGAARSGSLGGADADLGPKPPLPDSSPKRATSPTTNRGQPGIPTGHFVDKVAPRGSEVALPMTSRKAAANNLPSGVRKRQDARFDTFKALLRQFYGELNGVGPDHAPWGYGEGSNLQSLLIAEPRLTAEDLTLRLTHRYTAVAIFAHENTGTSNRRVTSRGALNPRESLANVIKTLATFAGGPVNSFGEPL